ncbi:MAG TPA: hypothetical protein GX401_00580 [Clostridiales bacterium]|nr:hypothetical protein [Clostridiales bacterium]
MKTAKKAMRVVLIVVLSILGLILLTAGVWFGYNVYLDNKTEYDGVPVLNETRCFEKSQGNTFKFYTTHTEREIKDFYNDYLDNLPHVAYKDGRDETTMFYDNKTGHVYTRDIFFGGYIEGSGKTMYIVSYKDYNDKDMEIVE